MLTGENGGALLRLSFPNNVKEMPTRGGGSIRAAYTIRLTSSLTRRRRCHRRASSTISIWSFLLTPNTRSISSCCRLLSLSTGRCIYNKMRWTTYPWMVVRNFYGKRLLNQSAQWEREGERTSRVRWAYGVCMLWMGVSIDVCSCMLSLCGCQYFGRIYTYMWTIILHRRSDLKASADCRHGNLRRLRL